MTEPGIRETRTLLVRIVELLKDALGRSRAASCGGREHALQVLGRVALYVCSCSCLERLLLRAEPRRPAETASSSPPAKLPTATAACPPSARDWGSTMKKSRYTSR